MFAVCERMLTNGRNYPSSLKKELVTDPTRMLIVEDDAVMCEMMDSYFSSEGFDVLIRNSADNCVSLVLDERIDICLVDIRLPGAKDGLALTHEIRAVSPVGIILVTSKDEMIDKIVGLESGADDYVTKPVELRELLSRIKNVLRRIKEHNSSDKRNPNWTFSGWVLDTMKRSLVSPDGTSEPLSEGEFQLLLTLVENCGEVMTRDDIMQKIRNRDWHPDDRYVDVLVVKLRQKFKQQAPDEIFISTVHGKGYIFAVTASKC